MVDRPHREIKPVGMTTGKKKALEELAKLRAEGGKRLQQYQMDKDQQIFQEVEEDEYRRLQNQRKNEKFVVDDEGLGYYDDGGEIWEEEERILSQKKKRPKIEADPTNRSLEGMLIPNQRRPPPPKPPTTRNKISDKEAKDIMNNLFKEFDASGPSTGKFEEPAPIFSVKDQYKNMYATNPKKPAPLSEKIMGKMNPATVIETPQKPISEMAHSQSKVRDDTPFPSKFIEKKRTREEFQSNQQISQTPKQSVSAVNETIYESARSERSQTSESKGPNETMYFTPKQVELNLIIFVKEDSNWSKIRESLGPQTYSMSDIAVEEISKEKIPLAKNEDGSISFFWIDAHEDSYQPGEIYLFGKIFVPQIKKYMSCTVIVKNLQREMFAIPNTYEGPDGEEKYKIGEIYGELEKIRKSNYHNIKRWQCKPVERQYAFELPIPRETHQVLKIKYDAKFPPLSKYMKGKTFTTILGTTTSMLELFILKKKIMGPCWMTIKKFEMPAGFSLTWSKYEIIVPDMKTIEITTNDLNKESPPLVVLSIALKHAKNGKNFNEIFMISGLAYESMNIEKPAENYKNKLSSFSLMRKIENSAIPFDFNELIKKKQLNIQVFPNEKNMLELFISKIQLIDPDIITGHDLCGSIIDLLINRIQQLKLAHWSRIGRFKRANIPKVAGSYGGSAWIPRQITCGRLLCDTFLSSKELIRETNYTLSHLCKIQLQTDRIDVEQEIMRDFFRTSNKLIQLVQHTEQDAYLTLLLVFKLNIIPLTKQLTNIAGNLWFRSLQNASRAERNEMLLLHEFRNAKFLVPDKNYKKDAKSTIDDDDAEERKGNPRRRKKAAYAGGLVLKPKSGFYDKYILLLDFNSLYPSIIQEYNLCFTTVDRPPTETFENNQSKPTSFDPLSNEEDFMADIPDPKKKRGILPNILKNLVDKRRQVKNLMKTEKNKVLLDQFEIRQRALKLTANSIYGCLGFSNSRFYAKSIAALITKTGREILNATVKLVTEQMNLDVIYGDTDSIMINSNTESLTQAIEIGKKVKAEVNKLYKCLEIEIDGVFQTMLLLKKKKYAALKLKDSYDPNSGTVKEIKGLDMVRRDWCDLSKKIGTYVLDLILSGKNRDFLITSLHETLTKYGQQMENNEFPLSDYVITKQITKNPSLYQDAKGQPHVQVALKLKQKGEKDTNLINHFIPFIICKGESTSFAERAYHPSELVNSDLEIDRVWYITQQILPPITRLLQHIDGTDIHIIAQCLGIDPKKHKITLPKTDEEKGWDDTLLMHDLGKKEQKYHQLTLIRLTIKCPSCQEEYEFPGIQDKSSLLSGLFCIKCTKLIPQQFLMNRIDFEIQKIVHKYFEGWYACSEPSCKFRTRSLGGSNKCLINKCRGKLIPDISEKNMNDSLKYLKSLFDLEEYTRINANAHSFKTEFSLEHKNIFNFIHDHINEIVQRNLYDRIDLAKLLGFMKLW